MKIELVAKQFLYFGGKLHKKGDRFSANENDAKVLRSLGRAANVEPMPVLGPQPKAKRAYKRRDMQAETLTSEAAEPVSPAEVPEPVAPSLMDEVAKVKNDFRSRFFPSAEVPRETLHVTRPKKAE